MEKPISKDMHGLIDYSYALIVPALPEVIGFERQLPAKILCRSLGAGALGYSLLTKARWGLFNVLPFKTHLIIDLSVSCLAIAAPWMLGFSNDNKARNTMIGVGLMGIAASLLTNPQDK